MARIALIIPTLDEAESIGTVVRDIPRERVSRIIVVDGGSADATRQQAAQAGAEVLNAGRGYGRACQAGVRHADDCDVLLFMDGDGADDPRYIAQLVGPIVHDEADLVLGSRTLGRPARGSLLWHQRLAAALIGRSVARLYGVPCTDMCAFRAIRRRSLERLAMSEMTYGWNLEMQMRAGQLGLRVREVAVDNRRRIGGRSKVAGSLAGTLRASARIARTFLRLAGGFNGNGATWGKVGP